MNSSGLEGAEGAEGAQYVSGFALFPGYQGGVQTPASTLLPGVDPETAVAVMKTREALVRTRTPIVWGEQRRGSYLPPIDCAERLAQWSVDIRQQNYMAELMGPVRLTANSNE